MKSVQREKSGWLFTHSENVKTAAKQSNTCLVIGDSIISNLKRYGKICNQFFQGWLNFGVPGDKIENVCWRVENGEIPKNVLLLLLHPCYLVVIYFIC